MSLHTTLTAIVLALVAGTAAAAPQEVVKLPRVVITGHAVQTVAHLPRVVITGTAQREVAQLPRVVIVGTSEATLLRQAQAARKTVVASRS